MVSLVVLVQAFFPCHDFHPVDARPFSVGSECVGRRYGRRRCAGGTPMSSGAGIRAAQVASSNSSWRSRWGGAPSTCRCRSSLRRWNACFARRAKDVSRCRPNRASTRSRMLLSMLCPPTFPAWAQRVSNGSPAIPETKRRGCPTSQAFSSLTIQTPAYHQIG